MPQDFPITYAALNKLHEQQVLHAKNARSIARRANLRSRPGSPLRTALCAYLQPQYPEFSFQFVTDFTGVSEIRFRTSNFFDLYLFYSPTLFGPLDPGDYEPVVIDGIPVSASYAQDTGWITLPEALRNPVRLTFSWNEDEPQLYDNINNSNVLIQAR